VNLSIHTELNHSEPEVQNNFIMLAYCNLCVCYLFIRAGNRGRWPASVNSLPYLTLPYLFVFELLARMEQTDGRTDGRTGKTRVVA